MRAFQSTFEAVAHSTSASCGTVSVVPEGEPTPPGNGDNGDPSPPTGPIEGVPTTAIAGGVALVALIILLAVR